ncbi:hypothetical protein OMP38_26035 [Cohnella ginsengisoli]|uniref:Uncharacterized protein n=1 Tax=Cohnella ginsengisoli TaxID=425004 RepID=A0A9X4QPV6_9BACL|nr:hypothetical protein [Cohnella ginsengisoli]MDG0789448.1 hypothetical protein [Cohnella ginsengisoli]MDG0793897.1 hypothetical protein [Cohnella ginsengisoli]
MIITVPSSEIASKVKSLKGMSQEKREAALSSDSSQLKLTTKEVRILRRTLLNPNDSQSETGWY